MIKARSEYNLIERISNNIMHDTEATKNMYEIEYSYIKENSISGVIREISSSPFGFIFMSQIQVLKYFKKTLNFYFILNWIYF